MQHVMQPSAQRPVLQAGHHLPCGRRRARCQLVSCTCASQSERQVRCFTAAMWQHDDGSLGQPFMYSPVQRQSRCTALYSHMLRTQACRLSNAAATQCPCPVHGAPLPAGAAPHMLHCSAPMTLTLTLTLTSHVLPGLNPGAHTRCGQHIMPHSDQPESLRPRSVVTCEGGHTCRSMRPHVPQGRRAAAAQRSSVLLLMCMHDRHPSTQFPVPSFLQVPIGRDVQLQLPLVHWEPALASACWPSPHLAQHNHVRAACTVEGSMRVPSACCPCPLCNTARGGRHAQGR